ncbi:MAG: hydroxymethylbilane synthase [Chthoniobacterales bacterium]|nr:hydroxymethylbilane synthase [Chthoniobacterales bacterium]
MASPDRIVLGSRGSELALAQARLVERALRRAWPALEVALEIIRTSGDESSKGTPVTDRRAGRKGMFTRDIEKELLVRRIDVAVHSAKDLPSARLEELEVRATLPRAHTEDVLITKSGGGLTTAPAGATIGTGSIRRQHQLRWKRPDLRIADLRGNVPTRLRKLQENETWSGIILARAGLERLGLEVPMEILSQVDFVPAGGQGVIALQIRRDDARAQQLLDAINDRATLIALRAEREFLRLLDGDCDSPVGVQATLDRASLQLRAQIFETAATPPKVGRATGASADPEAVAAALMRQIYGG